MCRLCVIKSARHCFWTKKPKKQYMENQKHDIIKMAQKCTGSSESSQKIHTLRTLHVSWDSLHKKNVRCVLEIVQRSENWISLQSFSYGWGSWLFGRLSELKCFLHIKWYLRMTSSLLSDSCAKITSL